MGYYHVFQTVFFIGIAFDFILNQVLEYLDYRQRVWHGSEVPPEVEKHVDKIQLEQMCAYEDAKYFLWIPHNIISTIVNILVVLFMYNFVFTWSWFLTENAYFTAILFSFFMCIPTLIVDIPFELIREFKIERSFGFSKMNFKTWLLDKLKGAVVDIVISVPLLCVAICLLVHCKGWWWLILGVCYLTFSFLISFVYPVLIAPLFNKFTPLEDGDLKDRLVELLKKTGFTASGIYVMDASKRTGHSNAYFTGFGKNKRIVLYDTLIQQLSPEEIEAVLGHELGHYKHKHIIKRMAVTVPVIFVVLFLAKWFVSTMPLYFSFSLLPNDPYMSDVLTGQILVPKGYEPFFAAYQFMGLTLLFNVFAGFMPLVDLVSNYFSRKHEFQADKYSVEVCGSGEPICSALIKLNLENLSEITPPKVYCMFNYDHPPLMERIHAIKGEPEEEAVFKKYVPEETSSNVLGYRKGDTTTANSSVEYGMLDSADDSQVEKAQDVSDVSVVEDEVPAAKPRKRSGTKSGNGSGTKSGTKSGTRKSSKKSPQKD